MSASNSVHASLESIGFVQLVLLFATLIAYSLALSEAFSFRVRGSAAAVALCAGVGFSAATPAWPDGIVLLAVAIVGVAGFAGSAWLLGSLLRLDSARRARSVDGLALPATILVVDAALPAASAAAISLLASISPGADYAKNAGTSRHLTPWPPSGSGSARPQDVPARALRSRRRAPISPARLRGDDERHRDRCR